VLRFLRNRLKNLPKRFTDLLLEVSKVTITVLYKKD